MSKDIERSRHGSARRGGRLVLAHCAFCGREMLDGTSCSESPLKIAGVVYTPIRWGDEKEYRIAEPTSRSGIAARLGAASTTTAAISSSVPPVSTRP